MSAGIFSGFFFHRAFARVSPVFAVAALCFTLSGSVAALAAGSDHRGSSEAAADPGAAERRQAASSQYARAEEQRLALHDKPAEKRTLNDYKQVVSSYRRVYLITPHASEVPDSLIAVAELYTEMGDRFGRAYYQSAVDSYQFLLREYPGSRFAQDAYLREGKLQKDQLGDTAGAAKTYDAFLKKFPHSRQRREAQEARAELALLQRSTASPLASTDSGKNAIARSAGSEATRDTSEPPVVSRDVPLTARDLPKDSAKTTARQGAAEPSQDNDDEDAPPAANGRIPQVRTITARAAADSARVTIDLEGSVQYVSGRVANPDRIYFDLHAARLAQPLLHKKIESASPLIAAIRTSQSRTGVVRVVLEVTGVVDYSASLLSNPSRLVIDLYGDGKPRQQTQTAEASWAKAADGPADSAASPAKSPAKSAAPDKTQPPSTASNARASKT